jgi:ATP-dependent Lhr-like helicase
VLLAATDPAQPYGVLLEWPEARHAGGRPRRAVGAAVILVEGKPGLFVDHGGRRLRSFVGGTTEEGDLRFERALRALARDGDRLGQKRLCIEEVDGEKARSSKFADAFVRSGFRVGYRGFEIDRPLRRGGRSIENDALGADEERGRD